MKTIPADVNEGCVKKVVKKLGRPPKIKRGRPSRIMFPELPKPPQIKLSFGCSVKGCTSTDKWMFTLPEADDLRERWLEFLYRPNWTADHRTRVCEVHFEKQMWKKTRFGQRTLLDDAFPTLLKSECGDKANENLNFVDMVTFEEPDDTIKSELLEPEIELSEEPENDLSSILTESRTKSLEEKSVSQIPSIKVENFYPMEEELVVPDLVAHSTNNVIKIEDLESNTVEYTQLDPPNNDVEEIGDLWWKTTEVASNDLSPYLKEGKGYMCPLCKKYLARRNTLTYHLEKTHSFNKTAQRLAADLKTRLKFKQRNDVLQEWFELFPDLATETNSGPSTLALTPKHSLAGTDVKPIPVMNGQVETDPTLPMQQLLMSNSYDPIDVNKGKLEFKIKNASSYMFCASLRSVPPEKRIVVKKKLMELVNAVIIQNIDPEKIIIAYTP